MTISGVSSFKDHSGFYEDMAVEGNEQRHGDRAIATSNRYCSLDQAGKGERASQITGIFLT